ncbi:hypothetical protein ACWGQ5_42090, partial [Streptomyces sp. NPDC055722]
RAVPPGLLPRWYSNMQHTYLPVVLLRPWESSFREGSIQEGEELKVGQALLRRLGVEAAGLGALAVVSKACGGSY